MGARRTLLAGLAAGISLLLLAASAPAATITPNTATMDEFDAVPDATCSLREATESAGLNVPFGGCPAGDPAPTMDTIVLTGVTYTLEIVGNEDLNAAGDLDVSGGGPLMITSSQPAGSTITVAGPVDDRIFDATDANLALQNLVITGGDPNANGGNIRTMGVGTQLTLRNSQVTLGNVGPNSGGGVSVELGANLSSVDSRIANNTAHDAGGIQVSLDATAQLTRTIIEENLATNPNVGGDANGGGIFVTTSAGAVTITDSEIRENTVSATNPDGGTVLGGGIRTDNPLTIRRTLFAENVAFSNGAAGEEAGGAVATMGTPGDNFDLVNSTFYANIAGDAGTQLGEGGALGTMSSGAHRLNHVTFQFNTAIDTADPMMPNPNGDHIHNDTFGSSVTLRGSIIPDAPSPAGGNPCAGAFITSLGYNAADPDPNCGYIATDSVGGGVIGLLLGGPMDNGGPTRTIGLGPVGRAVDLVTVAQCGPAEGTDQRGFPRAFDGDPCDAGAYDRIECRGAAAGAGTRFGTSVGDAINGTQGPDFILAGPGNDQVNGMGGNDRMCGDSGTDTLTFVNGGGVQANLANGNSSGQGSDVFAGFENLTGSPRRDVLIGNRLKNIIRALKGNDTAKGGAGNDRLFGQAGKDRLFGQAGRDKLFGQAGRDKLVGGGRKDVCNGGARKDPKPKSCEIQRKIP